MNETVAALNSLSIFGPHQAGAYREHSAFARSVLGDDIPTRTLAYVKEWAAKRERGTLVLTGNAGTGKTALAQLFCDEHKAELPTTDALAQLSDSAWVVKDLSGVVVESRGEILELEARLRHGHIDGQLFICANEGVLRDAMGSADDRFVAAVSEALTRGVYSGSISEPLTIVNLNRQRWTGSTIWEQLLDYLTRETLWEGCDACAAAPDCPIRANAVALRQDAMRESMRHLFQFGSGMSVATLRQILAILAQAITGGFECEDLADRNDASVGYFNQVFGDQLTAEEVERSSLLTAIRSTELGDRSDIQIDRWLRDSATASAEVRASLASDERKSHTLVKTDRGVMALAEFGERLSISDDADEVLALQQDLVDRDRILATWRRKVFFELQSEIGGRSTSFSRLTAYPHFGALLDLADSIRRGLDVEDQKQYLIKGLNFLVAGFHGGGQLIVPETGSLIARDPGAFRPPSPSMVHQEVNPDLVHLANEDSDALFAFVDADEIQIKLSVEQPEHRTVELLLTPRLHHAICESADFRAPAGSDVPEMNEVRNFYGELAASTSLSELQIVDPVRANIRKIALPRRS